MVRNWKSREKKPPIGLSLPVVYRTVRAVPGVVNSPSRNEAGIGSRIHQSLTRLLATCIIFWCSLGLWGDWHCSSPTHLELMASSSTVGPLLTTTCCLASLGCLSPPLTTSKLPPLPWGFGAEDGCSLRSIWQQYRYHVGIYIATIEDITDMKFPISGINTTMRFDDFQNVKGWRTCMLVCSRRFVQLHLYLQKVNASALFWRTLHGISPVALDFVHFAL